jgi:hypothetical protein
MFSYNFSYEELNKHVEIAYKDANEMFNFKDDLRFENDNNLKAERMIKFGTNWLFHTVKSISSLEIEKIEMNFRYEMLQLSKEKTQLNISQQEKLIVNFEDTHNNTEIISVDNSDNLHLLQNVKSMSDNIHLLQNVKSMNSNQKSNLKLQENNISTPRRHNKQKKHVKNKKSNEDKTSKDIKDNDNNKNNDDQINKDLKSYEEKDKDKDSVKKSYIHYNKTKNTEKQWIEKSAQKDSTNNVNNNNFSNHMLDTSLSNQRSFRLENKNKNKFDNKDQFDSRNNSTINDSSRKESTSNVNNNNVSSNNKFPNNTFKASSSYQQSSRLENKNQFDNKIQFENKKDSNRKNESALQAPVQKKQKQIDDHFKIHNDPTYNRTNYHHNQSSATNPTNFMQTTNNNSSNNNQSYKHRISYNNYTNQSSNGKYH